MLIGECPWKYPRDTERIDKYRYRILKVDPKFDIAHHIKGVIAAQKGNNKEALKNYNIKAERKKGLTGVWVNDKKIAALGVRISRWVTMHGFSLNINPDLKYYQGIIPCGISQYGVTSMANILGDSAPKMSEIKEKIVSQFISNFSAYKN